MARGLAITSKRATVSGLKELQEHIEGLAEGFDGRSRTHLAVDASAAMGEAAREDIAEVAKANARNQSLPDAVTNSIFVDQRITGTRYRRLSVLTGVNKRKTMTEWTATNNPKSPHAKVSPGGKVAMSLATMFEFGTSRMRPRPYMRPAVDGARATIAVTLAKKLRGVVERWAR